MLVIKLVVVGGGDSGDGDNVGGFGGILVFFLFCFLVVLVGRLEVGWAVAVGAGGGDDGYWWQSVLVGCWSGHGPTCGFSLCCC